MTPVSVALYTPPLVLSVFFIFFCLSLFLFLFSFFFSFLLLFLSFSVVLSILFYSFSASYLILMDLFFYGLTSLNSFATLQNVLLVHVKHTSLPNQRPQAYRTAYFIKENLIKTLMSPTPKNSSVV